MVPKTIAIFRPSGEPNNVKTTGKVSSGIFSFLSVTEMHQPGLLLQYQSALKEQLTLVAGRLQQTTNTKNTIVPNDAKERRANTTSVSQSKGLKPQDRESISASSTSGFIITR